MKKLSALIPLLLIGCASNDINTAINDINQSISDAVTQVADTSLATTAGAKSGYTSIKATKLYGLLATNLSTDGSIPEWPKIAIRDFEYPRGQSGIKLKTHECAYFNATIWFDNNKSERIENISLCPLDMPKQSNMFVNNWRPWSISGETSGQLRTEGPKPPYYKLPTDGEFDSWMGLYGLYYIGSMLTLSGFDYHFLEDDRRFWVVNVK